MLLSTEKQTPLVEIKSKLDTDLPLEKYGDIGDYYEFNQGGSFYYDLTVVNPELITLFLVNLDNETASEIVIKEGENKIFLNIKENLCLILIGNSADAQRSEVSSEYSAHQEEEKNIGSVEIINRTPMREPSNKLTVSGIGDYLAENNKYFISTNKGKGISTVSEFFFSNRKYLSNISIEYKQGSGIALMNLETGKYTAEIQVTKSDSNDVLLIFNGLDEPLTINSQLSENPTTFNFDVPYGYLYWIAIDKLKTSGTTEFIVRFV